MTFNMVAVLAAPREGPGAGMVLMIQFALIILIFYWLLIRPQRKAQQRHREMLERLRKGDEVMTDGGIIGEVVHLKDDRVTVKTGENTRIVVSRPKIARVFTQEETEGRR